MTTRTTPLMHHIRRLAAAHAPADAYLLDCFLPDRDDNAFAGLVERHGPMVLRVCRRVLGTGPDAEDAFQAVFLVLAPRLGTTLRRREGSKGEPICQACRYADQRPFEPPAEGTR
jgi:hypothetical protein